MPDPNLSAEFHITVSDLKPDVLTQSANAFTLRGEPVMLAPDVALIFQVETRKIVQNITRNPDIFPERSARDLTRSFAAPHSAPQPALPPKKDRA